MRSTLGLPLRCAAATLFATACLVSVAHVSAEPRVQAPPRPVAVTPAPRTEDWGISRQNEVVERARRSKGADIVFVGDSITQGWEGGGADAWKSTIAPLGSALNLGVSGDRTEHVLWRLQEAPLTPLAPRAVVLMIGTNNLGHGSSNATDTALGIRTVVDRLVEQCPDATIILLGIFPRGRTLNPMRGDICQINQSLEAFAAAHPSHRVAYHDIGFRFLAPDGTIPEAIMPDELHLSPEGYARWANAVTPLIRTALTATANPSEKKSQ
jgi:lysophospholipase L1-like esterase